ncbi:TetR/AcrR family transcriptional regulator [Myceligenerans indicum]|uniref:TetR/AcrR family transcriptional regulator n=1 Tax=Myceligenerans indicum TaxID=2593663 RepID=A0ABS1LL77_9MICO|nr:TetR/AcrR family transcriptional regulator [Myceligenerans indicum]MBL0886991.1 TetR/AcrR family transcriptional regulator [Myceligenerans indicum]
MSRTSSADAELRSARARLVAAAQELFARQGVGATSPRQVMSASGVGQGSLYHHFPTKRDLAVAGVAATTADAVEKARADLRGDSAALERIGAYVGRRRDALAGCKVGRLTSDQAVMDDGDLHAVVTQYFTDLLDEVTATFRETGLGAAAARDRAHAAVAIVQGGYVLARATGDPGAMHAAVRGFLSLLRASDGAGPASGGLASGGLASGGLASGGLASVDLASAGPASAGPASGGPASGGPASGGLGGEVSEASPPCAAASGPAEPDVAALRPAEPDAASPEGVSPAGAPSGIDPGSVTRRPRRRGESA